MRERKKRGRWGGGFGRLEVEVGCVLGGILLCRVRCAVPFFLFSCRVANLDAGPLEMKLIIAAIYTNFSTHVVDDEGIEQEDAYTAGPRGNKLMLRFERVE